VGIATLPRTAAPPAGCACRLRGAGDLHIDDTPGNDGRDCRNPDERRAFGRPSHQVRPRRWRRDTGVDTGWPLRVASQWVRSVTGAGLRTGFTTHSVRRARLLP
jgi:hypothetical protein